LGEKINFSGVRSENFFKIIPPFDSSQKITYMYVQSSCFELFFHDFFELEHERTLFGHFSIYNPGRLVPFSKANY